MTIPARAPVRRRATRSLAMAIGALLLLAIAAMVPGWMAHLREAQPETLRFSVLPPPNTIFASSPASVVAPQLAISPDGRLLAFVATARRGRPALWVRSLTALEAQTAAGDRGRQLSVLVARQSIDRLLRARQAQDNRDWRRTADNAERCASRFSWRHVESRGHDPVFTIGHGRHLPGTSRWRARRCRDEAERVPR